MSAAGENEAFQPSISVIIPAWNEAIALGPTLAAIRSAALVSFEIVVVDAKSTDETVTVAQAAGAQVVTGARRQRAHQLNLGAQRARGEILLFVHADTLLPASGLKDIVAALVPRETAGGAFVRRYASSSRWLRATCRLARLRNQLLGWHLGDQAMFVRRSIFFQLGGFRDVQIFEDLDFSRRLKELGRIVTLSPGVTSSARRFQNGPGRTTLRDFCLTIGYLVNGLPTEDRHPQPCGPVISSTFPWWRRLSSALLWLRG